MVKKILFAIIAILFIGSNSLIAQPVNNRVEYLNAIGDSVRFSICVDIIDSLMANKKVDALVIKYDCKSQHYIVNEEYVRAIRHTIVKTDSSIIANFDKRLKLKFNDIKNVYIDSIGVGNFSFLEEYYFFGTTPKVVYIQLQNPIEGWEPLKVPLFYWRYWGIDNSRFKNVLESFPFILSIPVRVMYNDGKSQNVKCYIFKYQIELDQTKQMPRWSFISKYLLY